MNLLKDLRTLLADKTAQVSKSLGDMKELKAGIDGNMYSPKYLHDVIQPEYEEKRTAYARLKNQIMFDLDDLFRAFVAEEAKADILNPEAITADSRLLSSGLPLSAKDLRDMWDRNRSNRTMQQLIFRYAQEHHITGTGIEYITARQTAEENVQRARYVARLYVDHWIESPTALSVLDEMLGTKDAQTAASGPDQRREGQQPGTISEAAPERPAAPPI